MRVNGSCHCGAITFEAEVDPARVAICHCTDCQKLTGSAFRVTVTTTREQLQLLRGAPRVYKKTGESDAKSYQHFCGSCGSPLYRSGDSDDCQAEIGLRWGAIAERDELVPRKQSWCRSRPDWTLGLAGLDACQKEG